MFRPAAGALLVILAGALLLPAPPMARADDADEQEATSALLQQYAPRVVVREQVQDCGPGEPFQPTSVDDVLANPDVTLLQPDGGTVAAPQASDLGGQPDAHLDFPGDPLNPGCDYEEWSRRISADTPPTLYARVASDPDHPGQLVAQYWFFWVYNDWNDRHEGDWEMVQLAFDADTAAEALEGEPTSVAFAQHEGSETSAWSDPKLRKDGTHHPVVYPAQGSHAAYFDQARWFGKSAAAGFGCDDTSVNDEVQAKLWEPRIVVLAEDDPQFAWLTFEGRWGQQAPSFNNGPTGPNTKDQWTRPVTWQLEEGRDSAAAIPAVPGPAVATFCTVTSAGSLLFIELLDRPAATVAAIVVVVGVIVALVRATRWRGADITNYDRERQSGQILSAAFRIYGRRFRVYAVLGALFALGAWGIAALHERILTAGAAGDLLDTQGTTSLIRSSAAQLVWLALGALLVIGFITAAQAVVASPHGQVGVRLALRRSVAPSAPALVVGFLVVMVAGAAASVLLLPVGLWLLARYGAAPSAAMVEGLAFRAALRRSSELTHQRRLRSLALTLALLVVAVATGPVAGAFLLLLTHLPFALINGLVVISYAVLLPVYAIAATLQFYDLRQEQERDAAAEVPVT